MGNQQIRPSYLWGSFAGILFSGKTLSCCVGDEPVQEQVATRGASQKSCVKRGTGCHHNHLSGVEQLLGHLIHSLWGHCLNFSLKLTQFFPS